MSSKWGLRAFNGRRGAAAAGEAVEGLSRFDLDLSDEDAEEGMDFGELETFWNRTSSTATIDIHIHILTSMGL